MPTDQTTLDIDTILVLTERAMESAVSTAMETRPEKLDWAPCAGVRTTLDILWELSECSVWFSDAILKNTTAHLTWEIVAPKLREKAPAGMSLEQIAGSLRANTAVWAQAYRDLPASRLDEPIPGSDWNPTPRDLVYFPLRNFWYHCGQIGYIQTCYGDFGM